MPRHRASIGTYGTITVRGYVRDDSGLRVPAPKGTRPTMWQARTRFRDGDGARRLVERWA